MIPTGMKLVRKEDYRKQNGGVRLYYEAEPIQTPDHEIVRHYTHYTDHEGTVYESRGQSKHQKFLCVNGPKSGEKITWSAGREIGYVQYNCADKYHKSKPPKVVMVKI